MSEGFARPRGPRLPKLAQTVWLVRDPVGLLERCQARYGPVFRLSLLAGYGDYVYVTDPALAREVYAADRTVGRAGIPRRDFLEPALGSNSLLCLEGDEWLRQRKLLGPALHRDRVGGYERTIAEIAARELDAWPPGGPIRMRPRMQAITLEVILRIVFGVTDPARLARYRELLPALVDVGASPLVWAVPRRLWPLLDRSRAARRLRHPLRRFLVLRDRVDALLHDEIALRRRESGGGRGDVLSLLIAARDEEGRGMTDVELRDELLTLLEAGHETTATALAWTFERLTRAPAAYERTREAVDAGDSSYLDAVVREALRTRSVILDTPRLLTGPLRVGGYDLPAGWHVTPAIPLVQHSPRAFDDPGEFRPERWLGDDAPRDGWIPFGGGRRHCVGSHLALLEMRVVLREVLSRFDLDAVHAAPEPPRSQHVTLVPADLALVRARRRAPSRTLVSV